MTGIMRDVRLAFRQLVRYPGFSVVAILTLAVGIGANATIFSLVDAILLRQLPYPNAERLVALYEVNPKGEHNVIGPANFADWRQQSRSFEAMAVGIERPLNFSGAGEPREVRAGLVSSEFFGVLGVQPAKGRFFSVGDDRENREVVLSHGFWQRQMGGDPAAIGKTLRLNDNPYTVVGILPASFQLPGSNAEVWDKFHLVPGDRKNYGRFLSGYARLRPGVSVEAARADLSGIAKRLAVAYPEYGAKWDATVVPLREALLGDLRLPVMLLWSAVGILLLIVCANLANLLLARASGRIPEMAVRLSLGASRRQLVQQLLIESLVLATLGGGLGLCFAFWGADLLAAHTSAAAELKMNGALHIGLSVVLFTLAISLVTALLFGIIPAWSTSAMASQGVLRSAGRGASQDRRRSRLQSGLIMAEVSMAVVLLAGAGLMARSFWELYRVDPGFRAEQAMAMRMALTSNKFLDPTGQYLMRARLVGFGDQVLERLKARPEIQAAGIINSIPIGGPRSYTSIVIVGKPTPELGNEPAAEVRTIAGDYFHAMGIPILKGRSFDSRDEAKSQRTFVIDEELANQDYPNENPIGRHITIDWGDILDGEIIGVVGSVRQSGLKTPPLPTIYWWNAQMPTTRIDVVVRSSASPERVANILQSAVRAEDPDQPIAEIRPVESILAKDVARPRLMLLVLVFFAGAALLLAAIGLYGVISYSVTRRTREIGVRIALGATPQAVERLVVGQGMRLALWGLAAGLLAMLLGGRLLNGLVYGVRPWDPISLVSAAVFLGGVAFLASWIPARRAVRTDATTALRQE